MKILGQCEDKNYNKCYICEIDEDEIAQVFNHYAPKDSYRGTVNVKIEVGGEIDLSAGYHFRDEITKACNQMTEAYKQFAKVSNMAIKFAELATRGEDAPQENKDEKQASA